MSTRVATARATVPALEPGALPPDCDVNPDDPSGYARDISVKNDRH